MNLKHHGVSPHRAIWLTIVIALFLYLSIGIIGGLSFDVGQNTNLLQAMYSSSKLSSGGLGWITFMYILFPVLTYITSIPVSMIVVRMNFMAAKVCSESKKELTQVPPHFMPSTCLLF